MGSKAVRFRSAASALVLGSLLAVPGVALAQSGGAAEPAATGAAAQAPGIDIPLIGRVELPGFMAGWFGGGKGDEQAADGGGQGTGDVAGASAEPAAVIVETVQTQAVGDTIDFIGTIQPIEQVAVRARVDGYIQNVAFNGGQRVRAGDLLFQIEPAQYEAALRSAEAQQAGAQATLSQAQRNFERQRGLAQSGVTARATLDDATAQVETARASLLQAEAAVTQAQLDLSYTRIEAAIDGVMSAPLITRGNYVSTTTASELATLTQMDPIWGVFPIGEGQLITWQRIGVGETQETPIARNGEIGGAGEGAEGETAAAAAPGGEDQGDAVAPSEGAAGGTGGGTRIASAEGTAAAGAPPPPPGAETVDAGTRSDADAIGDDFRLALRLPNGADYEPNGRFDFVGNTVNAATGTVEARIAFPNPGGILLDNQNVSLVASEKNPPVLPVVPQAAIQLSREGRSVLVVNGENVVERRPVTTGKTIGNMASVTSGLSGGETVIVRGSASAKEGATVRPLSAAEAEAEAEARRQSRGGQTGGATTPGTSDTGTAGTGGGSAAR
ncbi:efflux RND transporter periplasmic adaptor subunit [Aureimonas sp. AU12]|uniref:efflux RND transporter periplasmic adaptor subunit n=1 Tax=Aureimonas sp. AU12 TaxID=1638161 RepID=UPI0007807D2A|nr:efflux RND transporter periplasmic adaptor subunit [Aureimonas sp. AU12]